VEDILIFYYLSFKDIFVFFGGLWKCRTRVLGWVLGLRKNSFFFGIGFLEWTFQNISDAFWNKLSDTNFLKFMRCFAE